MESASQELFRDIRKTPYNRMKRCRERKRMQASEWMNDAASTSAAGASEAMRVGDVITSLLTSDFIDIKRNDLRKTRGRVNKTATTHFFI